jgi:hypothetical protein
MWLFPGKDRRGNKIMEDTPWWWCGFERLTIAQLRAIFGTLIFDLISLGYTFLHLVPYTNNPISSLSLSTHS